MTRKGKDPKTGRFTKGNKLAKRAKGKHKPSPKEYEERMRECVALEDWDAIILEAVRQAIRGDYQARKWLSDHLVGVPVQRVAPTDPSGDNPYSAATDWELLDLARRISDRETSTDPSNE